MEEFQVDSINLNLFPQKLETTNIFKVHKKKDQSRADLRKKLRKKLRERREKFKQKKGNTDGLSLSLVGQSPALGTQRTPPLLTTGENPKVTHLASIIEHLWKIAPVTHNKTCARVLSSERCPCFLQRNIKTEENIKQLAMMNCYPPRRKKKPLTLTYKKTRKKNIKKLDFYFRFKHHIHQQSSAKRVNLCSDQRLTELSSMMSCYQQPTKKCKTRNIKSCFDESCTVESDSPPNTTTIPLGSINFGSMGRNLAYHIKPLFDKEKIMWRSIVNEDDHA